MIVLWQRYSWYASTIQKSSAIFLSILSARSTMPISRSSDSFNNFLMGKLLPINTNANYMEYPMEFQRSNHTYNVKSKSPEIFLQRIHTKLTRKFCLNIWLDATVHHKEIIFQLDWLSRRTRSPQRKTTQSSSESFASFAFWF